MHEEKIQSIIKDFLANMGMVVNKIETAESELPDYIKVSVDTDDSRILIGKDGEHLSALVFLVRKIIEKEFGENAPRFFIDIGGYQANKIQRIQKVARIMADRATSFKRDIELPPMSAYERMVIHSTLAGHGSVGTESEGQGSARRVIVRYREETI